MSPAQMPKRPISLSELHPERLVNFHALANAEVQHDLLAPTRDLVCQHIPIQPFNLTTLSTSGVAQPAKDLRSLLRAELKSCRGLRL